jgi:phosphoribosylaminoimidazolecarboxamide formyltransferase/IMP cyclohydrolase
MRSRLAQAAFARTAAYDLAISTYLAGTASDDPFPESWPVRLRRRQVLRYGENPHQAAALYAQDGPCGASMVGAGQLAGKELSYNNLLDLDSALALVRSFDAPAAAVIKHNNPCGAAAADTLAEAVRRAFEGDPVSAFGSVLGFNRSVDAATAEFLCTPGLFVEAIAAPDFAPDALEILTTRPKWKLNVRLLKVGRLDAPSAEWHLRQIEGGMLVQQTDTAVDAPAEWTVPTASRPTDLQMADLRFAWTVVRHVKSNAIVVARERMVTGVGAGQMSRIDSVEIALTKSGERARGAVLASDAFFPFADSIQRAAAAGVAAVIQPGGSKRDEEVVAECNRLGLSMVLTGRRHFKH